MDRISVLIVCAALTGVPGAAARAADEPEVAVTGAGPADPPAEVSPPPRLETGQSVTAAPREESGPGVRVAIIPRFFYEFPADLEDSGAESSVVRAGLKLTFDGPIGDRARWNVDLDTEASWYNWHNASTLVPSGRQPIGDAYQLRLLPGLAYAFDQHWSIVGGGILEIAGEGDADIGDSATYGGYAGLGYSFSENFSLTLGGAFKSRLESGASFYPLIGVQWKISDKVSLMTEGLGGRLIAKINDQFTGSILARYDRREFRLEDDGAIPNGIVRDTRVYVGAGLAWQVCDSFTLNLDGGVVVYQEFRFDDRDGNRLGDDRADPTPFVGISGAIKF